MILETIKNFPEQFRWEPIVARGGSLTHAPRAVILGMGGSALAGDLVRALRPNASWVLYRGYGLPDMPDKDLRESLAIAVSYSGNTEEILDGFETAGKIGMPRAAVTRGGELGKRAEAARVPAVEIPGPDIEPRLALGFQARAILKILGDDEALGETSALADALDAAAALEKGGGLARSLGTNAAVFYSSFRNRAVGYAWKVIFNETAKMPAFANSFPELNHNEMEGFGRGAANFSFIFLRDADDHPRVLKRMDVYGAMLRDAGAGVLDVDMPGSNRSEKVFGSVLLAHAAAASLAASRGVEAGATPQIEAFKKSLV